MLPRWFLVVTLLVTIFRWLQSSLYNIKRNHVNCLLWYCKERNKVDKAIWYSYGQPIFFNFVLFVPYGYNCRWLYDYDKFSSTVFACDVCRRNRVHTDLISVVLLYHLALVSQFLNLLCFNRNRMYPEV